jgi:hypothetical protein
VSAMAVLYARRTGHTLGALTTTVPGDPPSLAGAATYRLAVPVPDSGSLVLTLEAEDLAIASLEAEFDDPLEVFGWRVARVPGPDGKPQPRLDRPSSTEVDIKRSSQDDAHTITIDVPRFGSLDRLAYEVRNQDGLVASDALIYAPADASKSARFADPGGTLVVLVEGYPPKVSQPPPQVNS